MRSDFLVELLDEFVRRELVMFADELLDSLYSKLLISGIHRLKETVCRQHQHVTGRKHNVPSAIELDTIGDAQRNVISSQFWSVLVVDS